MINHVHVSCSDKNLKKTFLLIVYILFPPWIGNKPSSSWLDELQRLDLLQCHSNQATFSNSFLYSPDSFIIKPSTFSWAPKAGDKTDSDLSVITRGLSLSDCNSCTKSDDRVSIKWREEVEEDDSMEWVDEGGGSNRMEISVMMDRKFALRRILCLCIVLILILPAVLFTAGNFFHSSTVNWLLPRIVSDNLFFFTFFCQ